jgi:hypothetical protein
MKVVKLNQAALFTGHQLELGDECGSADAWTRFRSPLLVLDSLINLRTELAPGPIS